MIYVIKTFRLKHRCRLLDDKTLNSSFVSENISGFVTQHLNAGGGNGLKQAVKCTQ